MKITWLGHSAFRIETGGNVILIDPFLTGNPTFAASGLDLARASEGVSHVALTHGHSDHVGDTVQICKATGATLVAAWEICNYLGGQGVANVSPGNPGGEISFGSFSIAFTPAWHSSSLEDETGRPIYLGNPCGLVVRPKGEPERTLYHMGDTAIFSDMELIQELYQPAIGIVPIGDRFTMGARQAALACRKYFTFKTIFPCHYGTFPIIDQSAEKFVKEMAGQNVVVPKAGQSIEI
ncbi:MAG: metal-dependent hydrolase [Hyphomicrobiaceae bacterium]